MSTANALKSKAKHSDHSFRNQFTGHAIGWKISHLFKADIPELIHYFEWIYNC